MMKISSYMYTMVFVIAMYMYMYIYMRVIYHCIVINHQEKDLTVIVEPAILTEKLICTDVYQPVKHLLQSWKEQDLGVYHKIFASVLLFNTTYACMHQFLLVLDSQSSLLEQVDFVICVGGDGTLLYTSSMFQVLFPFSEQLLIYCLLLFPFTRGITLCPPFD